MSTPAPTTIRLDQLQALVRSDSWQNLFTNLGVQGQDANESSSFAARKLLTVAECKALYEQNWQAGRAVDVLAEDAVKAWFELTVEDDTDAEESDGEDKAKAKKGVVRRVMDALQAAVRGKKVDLGAAVAKEWERLAAKAAFEEALAWCQAFGGSAILIGADDGQKDWSLPLNLASVRGIRYLHVLERRYVIPSGEYDWDDQSSNYGRPLIYDIQPNGQGGSTRKVHWTRLLRFDGERVSAEQRQTNQSWGNPVFERFYEPLRHLQTVMQATATACQSFSQGVLKIQDLAALLETDQEQKILARLVAFKMGLSMANIAMIDAQNETYERVGQPVTGLRDLIDAFQLEATGATRTPQSKTYGAQQGKLAGSTEDTKTWDGRVQAYQEKNVLPQLRRLTEVILAAKEGPLKGKAAPAWALKPNPLTPPDLSAEVERRERQMNVDKGYYEMEVLEASEIRKSRFDGPTYSHETTLDPEITERLEEAEREEPTEPEGTAPDAKNVAPGAPGAAGPAGGAAGPGGAAGRQPQRPAPGRAGGQGAE